MPGLKRVKPGPNQDESSWEFKLSLLFGLKLPCTLLDSHWAHQVNFRARRFRPFYLPAPIISPWVSEDEFEPAQIFLESRRRLSLSFGPRWWYESWRKLSWKLIFVWPRLYCTSKGRNAISESWLRVDVCWLRPTDVSSCSGSCYPWLDNKDRKPSVSQQQFTKYEAHSSRPTTTALSSRNKIEENLSRHITQHLYVDNRVQLTDLQGERTVKTSAEEIRGSCAGAEKWYTRQVIWNSGR